jgi:hypothetical protein
MKIRSFNLWLQMALLRHHEGEFVGRETIVFHPDSGTAIFRPKKVIIKNCYILAT